MCNILLSSTQVPTTQVPSKVVDINPMGWRKLPDSATHWSNYLQQHRKCDALSISSLYWL